MAQRIFITVLGAASLLIPGAGSVGSAWAQSSVIAPAAYSPAVPDGLSGTWHGTFQEIAASYRDVEGWVTMHINDDGTFTATSPSRPPVSGTVSVKGNRVIFQSSKGARTTLMRSGNTLYGVTDDLATEAHVSIRLDKS